jgi:hypothetical protein
MPCCFVTQVRTKITMGGGAVAAANSIGEDRSKLYTGHITFQVVLITIIAASGGLIFGFDNGEGPAACRPVLGHVLRCTALISIAPAQQQPHCLLRLRPVMRACQLGWNLQDNSAASMQRAVA